MCKAIGISSSATFLDVLNEENPYSDINVFKCDFCATSINSIGYYFQSQPTEQQLIPVIESAAKDKNYSTVLRVSNNAIKLFPDLATAYYYHAIALSNLGKPEEAKADFEQAKKLYIIQLKNAKIGAQEKNEARIKLETVEQNLLLLKS